MQDLLLGWVVFPGVLLGIVLGCGRLLRAACPRIADPLLAPCGFGVLVLVGALTTLSDQTAELGTPLMLVLALAGLLIGGLPAVGSAHRWPAAAFAAVFAVYAAPIVLSGEATFAGYIKLDDTATWLALTDRVMEHGRSLEGLAPSSYEATLAFNLGDGYPIGVFVPLGAVSTIVGLDPAWTIQPYMAFLAALLALALYELGRPLVTSPPLRALAAFLAAQAALLYGYYLWGGIKELAAAALVATGAALAAAVVRERGAWPAIASLAVVGAALAGVLSPGGLAWLAPAFLVAAVAVVRARGLGAAAVRAAGFVAALAAASLPVLIGGLVPPTSAPLTASDAMGNLAGPLELRQLAGIWPAGDFRFDPDAEALTDLLVAAAVVAAGLGGWLATRRRALAPLLYAGGALAACLAIASIGSPWVDGKAFATAAPAIPFAAALAGGALWLGGRRVGGGLVLALLAAGIVWSNALAYRESSLAPRDQLAELEAIGERIAGQGPTLMTEYQPYGVRHFLRDADPEGVSELRRRRIPRAGGRVVPKGLSADTDELSIPDLLVYRTLVVRRSPVGSRPPAPYRLLATGEHYEVWQRAPGPVPGLTHLPLGGRAEPTARPRCGAARELAEARRAGGVLVAALRPPPLVVPLARSEHPESWQPTGGEAVLASGSGVLTAKVDVERAGSYEVWLGGSLRGRTELRVDGEAAGTVRNALNNAGQYVRLGSAVVEAGRHTVEVRIHGPDLHPGSGAAAGAIGPLALSRSTAAGTRLERIAPAGAGELCRARYDWLASVGEPAAGGAHVPDPERR